KEVSKTKQLALPCCRRQSQHNENTPILLPSSCSHLQFSAHESSSVKKGSQSSCRSNPILSESEPAHHHSDKLLADDPRIPNPLMMTSCMTTHVCQPVAYAMTGTPSRHIHRANCQ